MTRLVRTHVHLNASDLEWVDAKFRETRLRTWFLRQCVAEGVARGKVDDAWVRKLLEGPSDDE